MRRCANLSNSGSHETVSVYFTVLLSPSISLASNCTDGEVRLSNGTLSNEGRVEICFNKEWGTICDDEWGASEARVVCKQLGYIDSEDSIAYGSGYYGRGLASIHLDELKCVGTENSLNACEHPEVGQHDCINAEDAGVLCIGKPWPQCT